MFYKSFDDAARDVVRWADQLPSDIDLVVGIPRSGMLVASLAALHLNLPLGNLNDLVEDRPLGAGDRLKARGMVERASEARRILVLDDSIDRGSAISRAKADLLSSPLIDRILWGALYTTATSPNDMLDFSFEVVPQPRVFQWNVLHHDRTARFCFDLDGVLCADPSDELNDDGPRYSNFISTAAARLIPREPIGWIVTSRLRKYEPETRKWLESKGIRYRNLIMYPSDDAAERKRRGDHGLFKAKHYLESGAELFVESDIGQAKQIAMASGRAVYCTDSQTMVYRHGTSDRGARPRRKDWWRWRAANLARKSLRR